MEGKIFVFIELKAALLQKPLDWRFQSD